METDLTKRLGRYTGSNLVTVLLREMPFFLGFLIGKLVIPLLTMVVYFFGGKVEVTVVMKFTTGHETKA